MAFQPSEMTEATLRRLVDNLVSFNKKSPLPVTPKRSQLQEAVAATLGFASYHAAITSMKTARSAEPPVSEKLPVADHKGEWLVPLYAIEPNDVPVQWKSKVTQAGTGRLSHVTDEVFADSGLFKGAERHRRNWLSALIAANPSRPICVVQGPMSLPIENLHRASQPAQPLSELFTTSSASELTEILVDINHSPGGSDNDMWRGRSISMLASILFALVYLRDAGKIMLESKVLRSFLDFEQVHELADHPDLPTYARQGVLSYLRSLPGYKSGVPANQQTASALENHGYLAMQFHKLLDYNSSENQLIDSRKFTALHHQQCLRFHDGSLGSHTSSSLQETIEFWVTKYPRGLLVFDVPPLDIVSFWAWLTRRMPHWIDGGGAIWLGVQSTSDLPESSGPLMNRLSYRMEISK